MGIISYLKGLFNKDLECKEDISNHFVYFFPLTKLIKVNSNIIVPAGFEAVFVVKDTVCDVLKEGKHKITNASLPVLYSKLKLARPKKNGRYTKKFKCDIYFVNLSDISTNFIGENPFVLKSYTFGKVKGYAEGMVDFRVVDSLSLIERLLIELPYIKNGKAISILGTVVGDEINSALESSDTKFRDIITHPNVIHKYLAQEMENKLDYMGIRILDAEISALRLNKKIQEKVSKYLENKIDFDEQIENFSTEKTTFTFNNKAEKVAVESGTMIDNGAHVEELDAKIVNDLRNVTPKEKAKDILFNRSDPSILFKNKGNVRTEAKVDSDFSSVPTKKQCKFCNATIDVKLPVCPNCGFRQDF